MNNSKTLANLIGSIPIERDANGRKKKLTAEKIAAYLDKHNVIVLPCAIGSTVWIVSKNCSEPYPARFKLDDVSQIGRRIFLTRDEALRRTGRGARR